jgi:hypothetical protein
MNALAREAREHVITLPTPNPKQVRFLHAKRMYVAFGGARGGGKSWAVRAKAILMAWNYPGITIMIIRRSYPELRANHIYPMRVMLGAHAGARYNDSRKEYVFPNGSRILFRHCATEADLDLYQGTEADVIFLDEATQFEERVFKVFCACLRGVNQFPKRMYLTCNPGGRGHGWVKRLFVDRRFNDNEDPDDYEFIQSLVTDNAALMRAQPEYVAQLQALPPKLRAAWLEGRWAILEGQFFEEFTDDPAHYEDRQHTHVLAPFDTPRSWTRLRSFDWGYAKPYSVGWWALSHDGVLYRILELYGCRKDEPDMGVRMIPEEVFAEVARIEAEHPYLKGQHINGVADPSIWKRETGKPIADTAAQYGVYFSKGDNERIPGWMQVHYRFAFDHNGFPMMYIFNTCKAFIRTIPLLIHSEIKPEDLDTTQEDHVADEARYLCMSNPIPPRVHVPKQRIPADDPLNLWRDRDKFNDKSDPYTLYRI